MTILSSVPIARVRFLRTINNETVSPDKVTALPTVSYLTVPGQHGYVDLVQVTSKVDPSDPRVGYLDLVVTDDADVLEAFGWTVRFLNSTRPTRIISVPQSGTSVSSVVVDGVSMPSVWLDSLATFTGPSGAVGADLSTRTYVDESLDAHEAAPDPHPGYALDSDVQAVRQLPTGGTPGQVATPMLGGGYQWVAQSGGGSATPDATTSTKGKSVLLGGTADVPTVPWSAVTGAPAPYTDEQAQDAVGAALTGQTGKVSATYDDGANHYVLDVQNLTKSDVGLNNVNNTADANKPVSAATQSALDLKASTASLAAVATSGSAGDLTETGAAKVLTAAERTKLAGVATGATANASDADLRDAATHTGQRTSASISDFSEAVQDAVAALLGAGSNIVLNYDDAANTLTVTAVGDGVGLDAEAVRDAIGVALVGVGNVSVVVNDAADTITVSTTATQNSTDAQLRDRSTHTGEDPISAVTGLQSALDAKQPLDADLTTIATLDATQAGALASDGSGWLRKTYAQLKTALGLAKADVGLDQVDNTSDAAKPVSTAQQAALDGKRDRTVTRHGLHLVEPDGGARYYDQFRFGLPSHPDYFPFALWATWVDASWQVSQDQAAGINVYAGLTDSSDLSLLVGSGSKALLNPSRWASYTSWRENSAVAGWLLHDEVDMRYNGSGGDQSQGVADLAADVASITRDGRMVYANFGKGVGFYGSDYWSRRYLNEFTDVSSIDLYWYTDADITQQYQGGKLVNGATAPLTVDQAHQSANYGLAVSRMRNLITPERRAPVWNFVELGQPFNSANPVITTAEITSAVWHSIIAGARGILFFNNTFGATPDYNILRNQASVRSAVTALTARVRSVARQINAPSVPALASSGGGVVFTTRYEGGAYWIIAGARQSGSQTATFTLNAALGSEYTAAEVVGESRTVPITARAFSDTFADKDTVHIYKIVR